MDALESTWDSVHTRDQTTDLPFQIPFPPVPAEPHLPNMLRNYVNIWQEEQTVIEIADGVHDGKARL